MSNFAQQAIAKYIQNAFKQLLKGKKSQFIIGIIFIGILILSYFYELPGLSPSAQSNVALMKGNTYACQVSKISDGDSITAICPIETVNNGKSYTDEVVAKIRVWGIDAPETKQAHWGEDSKKALTKLLPTKKNDIIEIKIRDKDRYNRYVSQLAFNGKDIGLEMVKSGRAVVYSQYIKDKDIREQYLKAQTKAQNAKKGIWAKEGNQQTPAEWRKLNPR